MYGYIDTCIFALSVSVMCGQAQRPILNNLDKLAQVFVNNLNDTSIAQQGAILAGDVFANSMLAFTTFADTLGQIVGNGQDSLTLNNSYNVVDLVNASNEFTDGLKNEDAKLNFEELLQKYGYTVEKYQVTTEDKYMLTLFRIPGNGSPIFLMHGLGGSAEDFILAGIESGYAYLLANEGFDVWLGNARGNKFSRHHAFLKPSEAVFWDFSWHEIGYYDLPAMIDYVIHVTGRGSLKYIGYSQGTTCFFVMASERPEYNKKIDVMIALSPVAFMSNMKTPILKLAAAGTSVIYALSKITGVSEFQQDTRLTNFLKVYFCSRGLINAMFCTSPALLFMGFSIAHTNWTHLPVVLGHELSSIAVKQIAHYGQEILSRKFRRFDYGSEKNLERYGSPEPPNYKLVNVVAPVVLFYSPEDWLAQPRDVEKLYSGLTNVVEKYNIPGLNHMDYILAKDLNTIFYPRILRWVCSASTD